MRCALVLPVLLTAAFGQSIEPGTQTRTFGKRSYGLFVPEAVFKGDEPASLMVCVGGTVDDFRALGERFVVCTVKTRFTGNWSGGETKEILELTKHLAKELNVDKTRIHAVSVSQGLNTIFTMLALGKRSPFVSVTLWQTQHVPGSVGRTARKKIGVLAFDNGRETANVLSHLGGRVRTLELRNDPSGISGTYYKYWLDVMEGRFEPGVDLSFDWQKEITGPAELRDALAKKKSGGFLYFFAADDKKRPHAKKLQNEIFLDLAVREHGAKLAAVKLDRAKHADWFAALELKETPVVVVLKQDGSVSKKLEGKIKATPLAKALKAVGPRK